MGWSSLEFFLVNKVESNSSQIGYPSRKIKPVVESKSFKAMVEIPKV